jgi:hypothetical protein
MLNPVVNVKNGKMTTLYLFCGFKKLIYSHVPALFDLCLPTTSTPPHFQAEAVLPLSLILLKRKHKQ